MKVTRSSINRVVMACLLVGAKRATVYLAPDLTVKATRRSYRLASNHLATAPVEILLTIGRPNYAEREFIAKCRAAGEPFPARKVQLEWFKPKG